MKGSLFIFFFFCLHVAYSQTTTVLPDLTSVPILELPHLDNEKLAQKELANRKSIAKPPEFARSCKVNTGCFTDGEWKVEGNMASWKLRILSEGAESLNFGFSEFYLPPTATFYMTGVTSGQRRGPFVSADNDPHDQFWSPIIEDDEVLLELEVDLAMKDHVRLHLAKVNHGFFKFGSKNFSGSCNLDVVCTAADGFGINDDYRDIIRSVVMYSLNGRQQCTGMLINNVREDGTPYLITADHCEISVTNASSVVVYYNYENSTCRQPNSTESGAFGDGSLATFNSGVTWKSATDVGSGTDFNIVQLDDPINPAANAFISGWNREDIAPNSAIAIHHPNTDEKRISYENDPLQITDNASSVEDLSAKYLRVIDWDTGTTEQGSSGSPLFDPQRRFIGQLFGGTAACGNNESDYYGRLAVSWEGGGSSTTRAKDYLDPDNIKLMTLDGIEASAAAYYSVPDAYFKDICAPADGSFSITTNASFSGVVSYTVAESPAGANISFSNSSVNPGDGVTVTISNTANVAIGLHSIRIKTEDTNGNATEIPLWLSVRNEVPGTITTLLPVDGQQAEIPSPTLTWQGNNAVTKYEVQVATENGFTNVIASASDLEEESWKVTPDLSTNTTYFWRVRGTTACAVGSWSATKQFTTGDVAICSDYSSTDVPKTLPIPQATTTTSTLQVSDPGKIAEVIVTNIKGSHTWISDLSFTLVSPSGTQVLLLANLCNDEDNFDVGFDDSSDLTDLPCPYTSGLLYKPVSPLSALQGEIANGVWQLVINDSADEDGGQLDSWTLEICTVSDPTITVDLSQDNFETCSDINSSLTVTPGTGFNGNVTLSVSNVSGLSTTFGQNPIAPGASTALTIDGTLSQNETIVLSATDGSVTVNKNITIQKLPVPEAALLTAPADMIMDLPTNIDFTWQTSAETNMYRYEVATDNQFNNVVATNTLSGTSATETLAESTNYFWRVLSINDCDSTSSAIRTFSVGGKFDITITEDTLTTCVSSAEYLIVLNGGIDGMATASISGLPAEITVTYENNPGVNGETIKAILSDIPLTEAIFDFTLTVTDDVASFNKELRLKVEESPELPVQILPANNAADVDTITTFEFQEGENATTHTLQVATDASMSNLVVNMDGLTMSTVTLNNQLEHNTIYYWRVAAVNNCGTSFSPIFQFQTEVRTDVDNIFQAESIQLAPNPTKAFTILEIETTSSINGDYNLYSINGQLLKQGTVASSKTTIDTSTLSKGMYLVQVKDGPAYIVKKLIIF